MWVITLCGSFKFKDVLLKLAPQLELNGNVVLVPTFPIDDELVLTDEELFTLGEVHREKIKMSDEVFIVDVDGYIGNSTKLEIEFAKSLGKDIKFLSTISK